MYVCMCVCMFAHVHLCICKHNVGLHVYVKLLYSFIYIYIYTYTHTHLSLCLSLRLSHFPTLSLSLSLCLSHFRSHSNSLSFFLSFTRLEGMPVPRLQLNCQGIVQCKCCSIGYVSIADCWVKQLFCTTPGMPRRRKQRPSFKSQMTNYTTKFLVLFRSIPALQRGLWLGPAARYAPRLLLLT